MFVTICNISHAFVCVNIFSQSFAFTLLIWYYIFGGGTMTTGERIRAIRLQKKLSQNALGSKLGISQQQIAQYERGTRTPKLDTIAKIANALDTDISEFLDLEALHPMDYTDVIFSFEHIRYDRIKSLYDQLNDQGKEEAIKRVEELTQLDKYKSSSPLKHETD